MCLCPTLCNNINALAVSNEVTRVDGIVYIYAEQSQGNLFMEQSHSIV